MFLSFLSFDEQPKPLQVLVVEDCDATGKSMIRWLRSEGHNGTIARDGMSALRDGFVLQPDVVLLDIGLPGMIGYQVARMLKEQSGLKKPLIVAITGLGESDVKQRAYDAGIDLHLAKPVDLGALQRILHRFKTIVA